MYGGAPALLVHLGELNNKLPIQLLDYYYDLLKQGKAKAIALQQAKKRYLQDTVATDFHPANWANWIQIGNTSNVRLTEPVVHIWWFILPLLIIGGIGWWALQGLRQKR